MEFIKSAAECLIAVKKLHIYAYIHIHRYKYIWMWYKNQSENSVWKENTAKQNQSDF